LGGLGGIGGWFFGTGGSTRALRCVPKGNRGKKKKSVTLPGGVSERGGQTNEMGKEGGGRKVTKDSGEKKDETFVQLVKAEAIKRLLGKGHRRAGGAVDKTKEGKGGKGTQ